MEDIRDPTAEIVDVLWREFRKMSDATPEERKKKVVIAVALCRMKVDDGSATGYLVNLVEEAINSDAPGVPALDQNKREIKGKTNPAFERLAANHSLKRI
jgi:hypothetical protein